jgi:hypothetical protein
VPSFSSPDAHASAYNYERKSPIDQSANDFHYTMDHENEEECDDINIEMFVEMLCTFIFYVKVKFNLSKVAADFILRGIKILRKNFLHYDKCLTSIHKYSKSMSKSWKK